MAFCPGCSHQVGLSTVLYMVTAIQNTALYRCWLYCTRAIFVKLRLVTVWRWLQMAIFLTQGTLWTGKLYVSLVKTCIRDVLTTSTMHGPQFWPREVHLMPCVLYYCTTNCWCKLARPVDYFIDLPLGTSWCKAALTYYIICEYHEQKHNLLSIFTYLIYRFSKTRSL